MEKVVIVCFLHGNEGYGLKVCESQSFFPFFIGNPVAVKENKRFVETDMNRCFPGCVDGTEEELLAHNLKEKLKQFDFVIDLHSSSNDCPLFGIVTKVNEEKIEFARRLGLKKLVVMDPKFASGKALIDHVTCGISLEVGPHERGENVSEVLTLLENLRTEKNYSTNMEIFIVDGVIEKKAKNISIKNFDFVKQGQIIAFDESIIQRAEEDFVAILVGEEAYGGVLCLAGEKVHLPSFINNLSLNI